MPGGLWKLKIERREREKEGTNATHLFHFSSSCWREREREKGEMGKKRERKCAYVCGWRRF